MDYGAVIGRAWEITRKHAWLWILGLLIVGLGSGTLDLTLPSGFNVNTSGQAAQFSAESVVGIVILIGLIVLGGLALWIVGVIARGGLIAAVSRIESEGTTSFSEAWASGAESFGKLFLIGLLTAIPALILAFLSFVAALPGVAGSTAGEAISALVTLCLLPLCCLLVLADVILSVVQHFADRAAVVEGLGPAEAFKRGWRVLIGHLPQALMLGGVWLIVMFIARLLIVIPMAGVTLPMLFLSLALPSIDVGTVGVSCLTGLIAAAGLLLFAVGSVFTSAMWTIAYRDWTGLPSGSRETREMPAPDLDLSSASDETLLEATAAVTGDKGERAPTTTHIPTIPPDPFAPPVIPIIPAAESAPVAPDVTAEEAPTVTADEDTPKPPTKTRRSRKKTAEQQPPTGPKEE